MRYFFLTGIALLMSLAARSQSKNPANVFAAKAIKYYNSGQADSLYALGSDEFKQSVSLDKLDMIIRQMKGAFGNLVKNEYAVGDKNTDSYIITFERSVQVLYLSFNKNNKMIGLHVGPDIQRTPEPDQAGSVTVKTGSAVLKGTLSVPNVAQKVPVVLLIGGSGPTDRNGNQTLGEQSNNLLKLSDGLVLQNIAVLRYDKPWSGQTISTKAEADLTFDDIVDDAIAFIKLLKADKRFSKIIVAGHSEGSLIGMLACEREGADAFISLSGPAVPADIILKTQLKQGLSANDYSKAASIIDTTKAGIPVKQKLAPGLESIFRPSVQPYWHSWMQYNPGQEIARLAIPVLIVQGTNDIQVDAINGQQLKNADPKAQLKLITGMNHILKEAPADRQGNIATYTNPDLPLHPQLVPSLVQFISGLK
jgi:pimeloyl-ACP methyl ester carboxylesterase